jgi:ribosome-associated toxin RatA of RatAB toxin-antitoxin module
MTFSLLLQTKDRKIKEMKFWIKSEFKKKIKGWKMGMLQAKRTKVNFFVKFKMVI